MDDDRKYRQRGYQDSNRESNGFRQDRPKPQGPRPPIDVTGPRLPRLLQNVAAARCFNCSTQLPPDVNWKGNCPKCNAALHCCKQCAHFEPSTAVPVSETHPGADRGQRPGQRVRAFQEPGDHCSRRSPLKRRRQWEHRSVQRPRATFAQRCPDCLR